MERKLLLIAIVLTLIVTQPVLAINYTEDGENPLSGGAQIPAGNHTFNWNGNEEDPDRIITIDGGDLTVAPGATITFVGVERLEIANGRELDCNGTQQNPVAFIGIADDPRPENPREVDGNPVTISLLAGATGDIEWTTFEVFGVALEADPQSALDITNGTFADCDVCVLDQTSGTGLTACTFTDFWTYAVHADGATQFIYDGCDFNSADVEGPPGVGLLTANHILCEDGDNESYVQNCTFDQEWFRDDEWNISWMRASIRLFNSSTRILNSTFNYDEIGVALPFEQLDVSVEASGNSDPLIKGCRTVCDAKVHVTANAGHTVTVDSCYFEYINNAADDCAIIVEDGNADITNCYMADGVTNIVFADNGNEIPVGGSVSNCVLAYTGRYWQRGFSFTGISIAVGNPAGLADLEISNNIFWKEGLPPGQNQGYWHGIDVGLFDPPENALNVQNNIFYDDNTMGQQWGEIRCIEGQDVDFSDDYNFLFQFEEGERFEDIGQVGANNQLNGANPDFIQPPFNSITFLHMQDRTYNFYLDFDSPCIDFGNPGAEYSDLNFTRDDAGIYGGLNAVPNMAPLLFGTVVDGQHEVTVEARVPADYTYIIPENVIMTFDEWVHVESGALLDVGHAATLTFEGGNLSMDGEALIGAGVQMEFAVNRSLYVGGDITVAGVVGDLAVFSGIDGGNWDGIDFGNEGGHNSVIDFAEISGSAGSGLDWSGSRVALLSNSLVHDNEWGIHTSLLNDFVPIENTEIYNNEEYGIFGAEVSGDVWILLCSIHNNGLDGIRIAGITHIDGCDVFSNGRDGICLFYGNAQIINCDIYQNSWSGIRLNGWQGGNGAILVGAQDGTNLIHNNGQYGMYVTDIHFINECNIIEHNPLYGVWVMGNFPAYFNTDHIRLNGPSTIGTGVGFSNGFAVMNHTSSDSNYFRGMEAWNLSWIDMAPPQNDPMWLSEDSSRFMNNGWQPTPPPLIPMANVDEIYLGSSANIWIANGSCDIYDNRFGWPGDRLITRNPNLAGVIDGITCYFGLPPIDPNVAFNPWNLVINFWQQVNPNYLNSFEDDEAARALLGEASGAMRQGEYEDAYDILQQILTEYTETPSAASCPGLLQVCIRELGLDWDENREFLEDLEVDQNHVGLLKSREQVVNMLLLYAGNFDEAIANFTETMEQAESLQDSVEAALNLAYAEHVRDLQEGENGIDGVGASLDSKVTDLLQLMHSDRPFTGVHPTEFRLTSVYPNPFNSIATINYSLPKESHLKISIHDLNGREVGMVYEGMHSAGNYSTVWKAGNVASGIYICRIKANDNIQSTKMTLLR